MYLGNYSAVPVPAVGAGVVVVVVVPVVVVSVAGATSSTVGVGVVVVVVVVSTDPVVVSTAAGLFIQPAKRATPATRTPRVSNFFIITHFNHIKKY